MRNIPDIQPHYTDDGAPCITYITAMGSDALHVASTPVRRPHILKGRGYHYSHTDTLMDRDHYVQR